MFVVEDVVGYERHQVGRADDLSCSVASAVCDAIDDWWRKFPAVRHLLDGPHWTRYRRLLTKQFLMRHSGDAENDDAEVDCIEHIVATALQGGAGPTAAQPLFSDVEQQFIHLRYRLGLTISDVAYVLDLDERAAIELGDSAGPKLEALLLADPNDEEDDWGEEGPPDPAPVGS